MVRYSPISRGSLCACAVIASGPFIWIATISGVIFITSHDVQVMMCMLLFLPQYAETSQGSTRHHCLVGEWPFWPLAFHSPPSYCIYVLSLFLYIATPILDSLWRWRGGVYRHVGQENARADENHATVPIGRFSGFHLQLRLVGYRSWTINGRSGFEIWRDSPSCRPYVYSATSPTIIWITSQRDIRLWTKLSINGHLMIRDQPDIFLSVCVCKFLCCFLSCMFAKL